MIEYPENSNYIAWLTNNNKIIGKCFIGSDDRYIENIYTIVFVDVVNKTDGVKYLKFYKIQEYKPLSGMYNYILFGSNIVLFSLIETKLHNKTIPGTDEYNYPLKRDYKMFSNYRECDDTKITELFRRIAYNEYSKSIQI